MVLTGPTSILIFEAKLPELSLALQLWAEISQRLRRIRKFETDALLRLPGVQE